MKFIGLQPIKTRAELTVKYKLNALKKLTLVLELYEMGLQKYKRPYSLASNPKSSCLLPDITRLNFFEVARPALFSKC